MVIAALLAGRATASASPIIFDFESLSTSAGTNTVTQTVGGVTVTVNRQDNNNVTVLDLSGSSGPPAFGARSIGNFLGPFTSPAATLVVSFSAALNSAGISFGDFNGDDDGTVLFTAFSGTSATGTNLGTASTTYPASLDLVQGNSAIRTLSVSAAGIQSFTIISGGSFPGTLYFDNVTADTASAVPEPASMLLVGSGVAALAGRLRGRRR
jgi:hypothetical protein